MKEKVLYKASRGVQISVFLDNEPGALSQVCNLFGENQINIHGFTVAEGIDHGYLRMVVDCDKGATKLLEKNGYMAFDRDVVLLEVANDPGAFGEISQIWSKSGVNIDYAYCAGSPSVDRGLVVVHVNDIEKSLECLKDLT